MKRISNNRDLFEANGEETIKVTVTANNTPYEVTFSDLESGGEWTQVQDPTAEHPIETRQFTMPAGKREFFNILYVFPPADQTNEDARYSIIFSGGGSTDGPNAVLPPLAGDVDNLPYEFRIPEVEAAKKTNRPKQRSVKITQE